MTYTSNPDSTTFMENLVNIGIIKENVFAFKFSNVKNDEKSEITFGGYNSDQFGKNPIYWQPNAISNKWGIKITGMSFGKIDVPLKKPEAEVVTSESHIRMPRSNDLLEKIYIEFR